MAARSVPPSAVNSLTARLNAYFQLVPLSLTGVCGFFLLSAAGASAVSKVSSMWFWVDTGCPLRRCGGDLACSLNICLTPISAHSARQT